MRASRARRVLTLLAAAAALSLGIVAIRLRRDWIVEWWQERRLRSSDPRVREDAARRLIEMVSVRSLPVLLEHLEVPDPPIPDYIFDIRRYSKVVAVEWKRAIPQLRSALGSHQAKVRRHAAYLLLRLGPLAAGAAPELGAALRDPDPKVRSFSAHALRRLGAAARPAMGDLIDLLSNPAADEDHRWCAAEALGNLGPGAEEAVAALDEATRSRHDDVQAAAGEALRKILGE